jgi:hypothetical protein
MGAVLPEPISSPRKAMGFASAAPIPRLLITLPFGIDMTQE